MVLPESNSNAQGVINESADVPQLVSASAPTSPESGREQTVGENRMRTQFNPSNESIVDQLKQKSAELIDLCESLKNKDGRLCALAQTHFELAGMLAVKLATA